MFKRLKKLIDTLLLSHATAEEVAQGFAWGVFIALTPTIGLQSILALGLVALIKKNELAALLGVWVTNPLTAVPIYYFTYEVGHFVLGSHARAFRPETLTDFFSMGWDLLYPLTIGGIAVSLIACPLSYFVVKKTYPAYIRKKNLIKSKIKEHHDKKHEA